MKHGFTLVELAIVIVIIGLLVGGVLQGQELVNQARIRQQISQLEDINAASLTFKAKYNFIPGDIPTVQRTAIGVSGGNYTGGTYTPAKLGNGIIDDASTTAAPNISAWPESYFFFMNLSELKLMRDGLKPGAADDYSIGVSFPIAKIGDGGIAAVQLTDGLFWFLGPTVKAYSGASISRYTENSPNPSIPPATANSLDTKLDDGIPSSGIVRAVTVGLTPTTSFANDATLNSCLGANSQQYSQSSDKLCRLVVRAKLN